MSLLMLPVQAKNVLASDLSIAFYLEIYPATLTYGKCLSCLK